MSIFSYPLSRVQKYKRLLESHALPFVPLALFLLLPQPAHAHAIAGNRVFPATLEVDDPSVATELTLPATFPIPPISEPNSTYWSLRIWRSGFRMAGIPRPPKASAAFMGSTASAFQENICSTKTTIARF